jgi:hypothetical protein
MLFIVSAAHARQPHHDLNAEPSQDTPHRYTLAIRFDTIDEVLICTQLGAEAAGTRHEQTILPASEWRFDRTTNTIDVDRNVKADTQIVRVSGRYALPLCITPAEKTESSSIRLVVNGRIGEDGEDFRYDSAKNEIILPRCTTGNEPYIILYSQPSGCASVGSSSSEHLTRSLRAHLGWPVDGNMKPLNKAGTRFSPAEGMYRTVWLVQILPSFDGYTGKDILSGFTWNSTKNELLLDDAVDLKKYSVLVIGDPGE